MHVKVRSVSILAAQTAGRLTFSFYRPFCAFINYQLLKQIMDSAMACRPAAWSCRGRVAVWCGACSRKKQQFLATWPTFCLTMLINDNPSDDNTTACRRLINLRAWCQTPPHIDTSLNVSRQLAATFISSAPRRLFTRTYLIYACSPVLLLSFFPFVLDYTTTWAVFHYKWR